MYDWMGYAWDSWIQLTNVLPWVVGPLRDMWLNITNVDLFSCTRLGSRALTFYCGTVRCPPVFSSCPLFSMIVIRDFLTLFLDQSVDASSRETIIFDILKFWMSRNVDITIRNVPKNPRCPIMSRNVNKKFFRRGSSTRRSDNDRRRRTSYSLWRRTRPVFRLVKGPFQSFSPF